MARNSQLASLLLMVHWLGPGLPSDHQLEQGSEMEEVLL